MKIICSIIFSVLALSQVSGQKIESRLAPTIPDPVNKDLPANTVAFFTFESKNEVVCVGSALSPRWIVTTATCGSLSDLRYIFTKTITIDPLASLYLTAKQTYRPKKHPSFSEYTLVNDIALIETYEVMNIDKSYTLPNPIKNWINTPVTLRGYKIASATLLSLAEDTSLFIASPAVCKRFNNDYTAKKLCTVSVSKSCKGDQGSPLVITGTNQLLGFLSSESTFATLCGNPENLFVPMTFVNILDYRPWIRTITKDPEM